MKFFLFIIALIVVVGGLLFFSPKQAVRQIAQPTPTPTLLPDISPTSPSVQLSPSITQTASTASITTSKGTFTISLYPDLVPHTVSNFVQKATSGFYNGLTFHRVEDWVVQGGDPLGDGTGGKDMPTELDQKPFVVGSVGVARRGDIRYSNDAQFFITKKDSPFLNGQYTNFGIVTSGMDIVNNLAIGDKIISITTQ